MNNTKENEANQWLEAVVKTSADSVKVCFHSASSITLVTERENMKHTVTALVLGVVFILSAHASLNELIEGSGCGDLKLGMSESEVINKVGTPQKSWIVWNDKQMDCLVINGKVVEIRINKGSEAKFQNGIGVKSTPEEIKAAFGEPEITNPKPNVQKWGYSDNGILFWIQDEKIVNQIVIYKPKNNLTNQRLELTGKTPVE